MGISIMSRSCVKVGCCGFPYSKKKYYALFSLVEVQRTFYRLPEKRTLEKWRATAPGGFEFAVKAWQVITHPPGSPTWRKAGLRVDGNPENYGYLKPTKENLDAWSMVVEAAEILEARIIVLQTPPSFGYTSQNLENAREFFREARRIAPKIRIAWEPRGTWHERQDELRKIIVDSGIIHVVDLLRRRPVFLEDLLYTRLHGLGGREVNYRYKYSDSDLQRLYMLVARYVERGVNVYVLFNNVYMGDDALKFRNIVRDKGIAC